MKRLSNAFNHIQKRMRGCEQLIAVMGLVLLFQSSGFAQWIQSSGNNQALNLQFANSGFVSIGAAAPTTYVSPYRLEVFGTTRFVGNSLIDNGNLTLGNGNLSVTGNGTFFPNGGVAPVLRLTNAANTFSTAFQSVATANVTYSLPPTDGAAGTVLTTNGAGALNWAAAGGVGGGGAPPFLPLWLALIYSAIVFFSKILAISGLGPPAVHRLLRLQISFRSMAMPASEMYGVGLLLCHLCRRQEVSLRSLVSRVRLDRSQR